MTDRYYVEGNNIQKINATNCNKDIVGIKAYGLLTMPSAWTPDFFVISKGLYKNYIECKKESKRNELIDVYLNSTKACLSKLGLQNEQLILRSSGVSEGMNERGKFESIICDYDNIRAKLIYLINKINTECVVVDSGMPFIVQKYIYGTVTGHLSNETRFSKEIRDWKFQSECNNEVSELTSLGVRNWRCNVDVDSIAKSPLESKSLKEALRLLAAYYTSKRLRRHIEFVYDEHRLYSVQADEDLDEKDAVNPASYDITMTHDNTIHSFKILRRATKNDEKRYNKINNVAKYHSLDIKTVPLYILDDYNTILSLSNNKLSQDLEDDLVLLIKKSVVIRSDIYPYKKDKAQLLKRSNELKDIDEIKKWLFKNSKTILEDRGAFIFHNFIPAVSAAFAYAKPGIRKVEIQSLWGLPEGLYYNAHDRIIVDTRESEIKKIDESQITNKDIVKKLNYKPTCILPDITGEWNLMKIARPYNWKCSIQDNDSIKQIAIETRKIAELEQKPISVMWFVGIDENYYGTKNIPWHHEECTLDTYTYDRYKRKYFSEEEVIIRSKDDLDKLNECSYVKCIRIQPDNDSTLRDKNFIKKVGDTALKKGLTVMVEGAVLAHPFYQLVNTGANVVVANGFKEYSEELEFNKLVRDKVPNNITIGGENVQCAVADDNLYLYLLVNKLIEEAYEAYDANDNDLMYELIDIYQVCESIVNLNANNVWFIPRRNKNIHIETKDIAFSFEHYLENKEYQMCTKDDCCFLIALSRKQQFYEIELRVRNEKDMKSMASHRNKAEKSFLTYFIDTACEIMNLTDLLEIKSKAQIINYRIINEVLPQLHITKDDFYAALKSKTNRNGAFEKKYVLLKTTFSGENTICNYEKELLPVLKRLPHNIERQIELLQNHSRYTLLIRKKVPMEYSEYDEIISNNKISVFFNKKCKLHLHFKHEKDKINIAISMKNIKRYMQLELNLG